MNQLLQELKLMLIFVIFSGIRVMCTAGNSKAIIILSDDDEEENKENDLSCLIVEVNDGKTLGNNTFDLAYLLLAQEC